MSTTPAPIPKPNLTKAMLARCQNELKQALCALDKDVQDAMKENEEFGECLDADGKWTNTIDPAWSKRGVYRLSPDAPTEPEVNWVETPIVVGEFGFYSFVSPVSVCEHDLAFAIGHSDCLGIVYRDSNGVETLRTSVDLAFGTPVRVRFQKPE